MGLIRQFKLYLPSCLLFLALAVLHIYVLSFTPFLYWEEMTAHPWLLDQGIRLYKDMFIIYPPGIYWIIAPVYELFGYTPDIARVISLSMTVVTDGILFYSLITIFRSRFVAAVSFIFYITWHPLFEGNVLWFESFLVPCVLLAYLAGWKLLRTGNVRWAVIAGMSFAVGWQIKQITALPIMTTIAWYIYSFRKNGKLLKGVLISLLLPIVLLQGIIMIYLISQHNLEDYFRWVIWFPISSFTFGQYFRLLPIWQDVLLVRPAFLPIVLMIWLYIAGGKYTRLRIDSWYWIIFFCSTLLWVYPRWGLYHLLGVLPFLAIGIGYSLRYGTLITRHRKTTIVVCVVIFVAAILTYQNQKYYYAVRMPTVHKYDNSEISLLAKSLAEILNGREFYSLENTHLLYALLKVKPRVLPWIPINEYVVDLPGVQEKIIDSIETQKIPYFVYTQNKPNSTLATDYLPIKLRDYLLRQYTLSKRLVVKDEVTIWQRK